MRGRRRLGAGRAREDDPRRLRGEPRGARRAADRPLSHPRARPAHAVADVGARARAARRTTGSCGASASPTSTARQLDEALELAPIAAVQVALSVLDDRALRGGVLERCEELGHRADRALAARRRAPGGRPRARPGARRGRAARGATPAEVALAWLLALSPVVVPIPGARRPETARSAARAAALVLDERGGAAGRRPAGADGRARRGDVVLVMGIPGAGKTRIAADYEAARLPPPEPRRARRLAARARRALDEALGGGRPARRPRQHLPDARRAELRARGRRRARPAGAVRLARHAARAGAGQPRRAPARPRSARCPSRTSCARSRGSPACCCRRRRCARCGSWSRRRPTRASPPSSGSRSARPASPARPACSSRPRRSAAGSPTTRARRCSSSTGGRTARSLRRAPGSPAAGPFETAVCTHGAGPPVCWCRPPLPGLIARVRAAARRRPGEVDARRRERCAPDARAHARRGVRQPTLTGSRAAAYITQPDGCLSRHGRRVQGARRPEPPPAARQPERTQRPDPARALRGAGHGSPVGEQAPRRPRGGEPRHHRPPRPGEAALPQRGADQRDRRALDHQLRAGARGGARRPETRTGGGTHETSRRSSTRPTSRPRPSGCGRRSPSRRSRSATGRTTFETRLDRPARR